MKMHFLIINGPNLNLLGKREVEIYGNQDFESYFSYLKESFSLIELSYFQSNHEGAIIDKIQDAQVNGIILNAAAYTHTSIAIRDAIAAVKTPVIEVHISDLSKRESFRQVSYLRDVCITCFMGYGLEGYKMAIEYFMEHN
ncbi:MAG TPA: type II 3-dehydroquinate dehydratase [Chitinophagaceae bacterium]|nr:type II 3-dehydroquinate dehydratase [Chitinophagaceae bacterium]